MIKAVFLDIDDTVLDFGACVRAAMEKGFRQFGLPPYEERMYPVFERVNARLWQGIERGELQRSQLIDLRWQAVFRELGLRADGRAFELFFKEELRSSAIPVPGAAETLPWLSARCLLCAASNGPYRQQERRLRISGFLPLFHHLFISEEISFQKPDARFFETAISRLNAAPLPGRAYPVRPEEILMVGDSLTSDMQGALNGGLIPCYFSRQGTPPPAGLPITYIITQLTDLRSILENE